MTNAPQITRGPSLDIVLAEAYEPFHAQLDELRSEDARLVFDYEDRKGNKLARAHVYKLRQTKSAIESERKRLKSDALEYGRRVDAVAKVLTAGVEELIERHAVELQRIEQREAERVEALRTRLARLSMPPSAADSGALRLRLAEVRATPIDDTWQEFVADAAMAKDASITALEQAIAEAEQAEAERAELERLRREESERKAREERDRIEREAKARADAEAEARVQAEREARERAEREAKEAHERAAREAEEYAERAEAEARQRAEQAAREERERIAAKQRAIREAEADRQRDEARRADVKADITGALVALFSRGADGVAQAIMDGEVPHVRVVW